MKRNIHCTLAFCTVLAAVCVGEEWTGPKITNSIYSLLSYRMIAKGITTYPGSKTGSDAFRDWPDPMLSLGEMFVAQPDEHTRISILAELHLDYSYWCPQTNQSNFMSLAPNFNLYIFEGQGEYTFGDVEKKYLQIGVGYVPFKYNPDARHLGEYLFRSSAYPQVLYNDYEFAAKSLLGLRLTSNLLDKAFHQDLLLTFATANLPFKDINLGYVARYTKSVFGIGAGFQYEHMLNVFGKQVTPTTNEAGGTLVYTYHPVPELPDSAVSDSTHYTFQALKLMGMASLDIKEAIPVLKEKLNPEDLRLYAEIAVLGVKDYGYFYNDITKRMPIMLGVYVPTFKVLDFLCAEMEYFKSDYLNNPYWMLYANYPIPQELGAKLPFKKSDFKWSIIAKKSFTKHIYMSAMFGRDHYFLRFPSGRYNVENIKNFGEAMPGAEHWQWMLRVGFMM